MANFADNILKLFFLYELIFYMNLFRPFADIFKFMSWNIFFIANELLLKFPDSHQLAIVKSPLVHIMAWHQIGDKPLHEPMLTNVTDAVYLHQTTIWLIISSFTEFKLVPISRVMISNQFSEWQQQNIKETVCWLLGNYAIKSEGLAGALDMEASHQHRLL